MDHDHEYSRSSTQLGSRLLPRSHQGQLHSVASGVGLVAARLKCGSPLPAALLL